ncbi:MAG: NUDIX domain-containing protein [Actinomycetota bacterium]|nr:NUDIX domain-containing protein [Actinomycetota bacterium]
MSNSEVIVQPAATVMLLRDTDHGLEVFMLRRVANAAFAAGMYVFPGGRLDGTDGEGHDAYLVAAVRECFEECGVLLAVDAEGCMVADGHPALQHREGVHAGTVDIRALAADHGLLLALDQLPWVAHWVTPKGEAARRFDTRFFMIASPTGQSSHHDDTETVASMWVRPEEGLRQWAAGEIGLMPPTLACLRELSRHTDVAAAMAWGRSVGTPPCILPKLRLSPEGKVHGLSFPGDDDYDTID